MEPLHASGAAGESRLGYCRRALAAATNYTTARLMLGVAAKHDSVTIEADARHLLTDVWTSARVLGGLLVIVFLPGWQYSIR